jgi:anti-sigma B factor antagonist
VDGFRLTIHQLAPGVLSVGLAGELDLDVAYTFDAEIRRLERDDPGAIVVDLRGLHFMDSSGLARILAADRRARRAGRRFCVVRGRGAVQRILAFGALDHVLDCVTEPDEVLASTA